MNDSDNWAVVGHAAAVARFKRSLAGGNLGHAYLITGPAQVGKTTLAMTLARAVNCLESPAPCGECPVCQRISAASHPDVQIIALGSSTTEEEGRSKTEISIKQVRDDIQHWASLPPFEGRCRVFIISEAELLSNEAANCLLKTLEEPQANVLFLLLTSEPGRLPETVVSRCQRVDLKPVAAAAIETALIDRGVAPDKARLLGRLSQGRPGWALASAGDEAVLSKREERIERLLELTEGSIEERFDYASELSTGFSQKRAGVQETLDEWCGLWRDMLLLKTTAQDSITNLDYRERLQKSAEGFNIKEVRDGIGAISKAQRDLRMNASPRLALDVLMLDMPAARKKKVVPGR